MDLNRLTHDADYLIRKVVSRYNQLYVPAGNISQLELDLMLDDLRKLYDTFKNIGQINLTLQDTLNKPEVKVNTSVQSDSKPVESATPYYSGKQFIPSESNQAPKQPQPEALPTEQKEADFKPVFKSEPEAEIILANETKEERITEPDTDIEPDTNNVHAESEIHGSMKPFEEAKENDNPVDTETAHTMLADKFSTGGKSLSEIMASSQAQGVMGSRVLFQPIADLTTGIGLNDKFSFIGDLFGNNAVQFDEAIHRINKAVNLDEATWILQKYHTPDWDHKQETLARLKDFVKRRFV